MATVGWSVWLDLRAPFGNIQLHIVLALAREGTETTHTFAPQRGSSISISAGRVGTLGMLVVTTLD